MPHKLVLRVLDADGVLLTWAEVQAVARGDGCLWAPSSVIVCEPCERSGIPVTLSIHWTDLNVETQGSFSAPAVVQGALLTLVYDQRPLMTIGAPASGLAPVTVHRSVTVGPQTGSMGVH